jgi:hypothetical protein
MAPGGAPITNRSLGSPYSARKILSKDPLEDNLAQNLEPTEPDREDGADIGITGTNNYLGDAHLID